MSIMHGIEYVGYIDPWTDEERLTDEEVVRCSGCKYRTDRGRRHYCEAHGGNFFEIALDDFCSYGERRDG